MAVIRKSRTILPPLKAWGTVVERERAKRIRVSLAAYVYECTEDHPIMKDREWDELCRSIDPSIDTGNPVLDKFFREEFENWTGMWIHKHPEKNKIAGLWTYLYRQAQTRAGLPSSTAPMHKLVRRVSRGQKL